VDATRLLPSAVRVRCRPKEVGFKITVIIIQGVAKNPARSAHPRSASASFSITVLIIQGMAKAKTPPAPPAAPAKRRGRPPRPGGPTPPAELQRAYRARLAAAGKVLKLVNADAVVDLAMVGRLRERLHNALLKLELQEQEVTRLTARNHWLENEIRRVEQHNTNVLKEVIVLRKEQAAAPSARARPRAKSHAK
jgi:hypothetical protein